MTDQIPHNDAADVPLDDAGAIWQGQCGEHGVEVVLDAGGEGVQFGQRVPAHCLDPGIEVAAARWCIIQANART